MDHSALTLLRLGLRRDGHTKLYDVLPKDVLEESIRAIFEAQAKYYRAFPQLDRIDDLATFKTWIASNLLATKDKATADLLLALVDRLGGPIDEVLAGNLANTYLQQALSLDAIRAVEAWQSPDNERDLDDLLAAATEKYKEALKAATKTPVEETSLDDLYQVNEEEFGFRWRLKELKECVRPLRPGDSVIWAARVDAGKTTSLASEITYMAPQIDNVFPGEQRSILWLNNEGDSKNIRKRIYQSAIGVTSTDMIRLYQEGLLQSELHKAFGGEDIFHRVKVLSVHGFSFPQIMKLVRQYRAGLVVWDMLDHVRTTSFEGARTDQILEYLYQGVRDHAVIEQFASICTSQLSAEAEGLSYPSMAMLKDSKTGKAGAAEAVIILGSKSNGTNTRYLGVVKNKMRVDGHKGNPACEVWLDTQKARLCSISEIGK